MTMERKIGEIFEHEGEWYQCVTDSMYGYCRDCASFKNLNCTTFYGNRDCSLKATCKKLESVGDPYTTFVDKTVQNYLLETAVSVPPKDVFTLINNELRLIAIEIKQNTEDMEEKKLNLKPFDIQKAREGKPVCTRDGRKARIICFDRISGDDYSKIVACVTAFDGDFEEVLSYGIDGYIVDSQNPKDEDLMMLPEKKEGLVNVYRDCDGANITKDDNIYSSKEAAMASAQIIDRDNYVATTKINWEE